MKSEALGASKSSYLWEDLGVLGIALVTPTGVEDPLGVTFPLVEPGVPLLEYDAVLCLGVAFSYRENLPPTTAGSNLVAVTSRLLKETERERKM